MSDDVLAEYQDELADCTDALDELHTELDDLKEDITAVQTRRDEQVEQALYDIRDDLDADDEYPLVRVKQHTRSGTDRYVETLTDDGVTTRPMEDKPEARAYITSPCTDTDGALAVEEYLDSLRGSRPMNALADRLLQDMETPDNELPQVRREYY